MRFHHALIVVCGFAAFSFSACTPRASVALLQHGTGATLGAALEHDWMRQDVGETGLSIEFPAHFASTQIGSGSDVSSLYHLNGSGVAMYALMRAQGGAQVFSTLDQAISASEHADCDMLSEDALFVGVDLNRPHQCVLVPFKNGVGIGLIGFSAAADVTDLNAVLLFIGEDKAVLLDRLLSLEQLNPDAQRLIDAYWEAHPQLTQLWPEEPSVQALDDDLRTVLVPAVEEPSTELYEAQQFMKKIAESAKWE